MVGWHHRLNGQKFQQALAVGDGQGGLACYSSWGHGIEYCGMEGGYSFIYDPEILNHSPGSILFLYREDQGFTW